MSICRVAAHHLQSRPEESVLAHSITLATRAHCFSRFPHAIAIAPELPGRLIVQVEIGVTLGALLEITWVEEFRWIGIEIDVIPVKRDELADAKPSVGKQRDNRLVPPLQVVREGVGKTDITNLLNLFGVSQLAAWFRL